MATQCIVQFENNGNIIFIYFQNKEKNVIHAFTQTDNVNFNSEAQTVTNLNQTESEPKSVTEDIKEAAEQAMQNMGFVYEETSGMYYDYNTGYYYNAVS